MALPKIILAPTDFSPASLSALDYAVDLAQKLGARVHVMHAYELPVIGFPDGVLTITADMADRLINAARSSLDEALARYAGRGVELTDALVQGDPRDAILTVAEEVGADLVVMGTHGRRGLARALIGSVAERVVRTSPVPVLTLHADEET